VAGVRAFFLFHRRDRLGEFDKGLIHARSAGIGKALLQGVARQMLFVDRQFEFAHEGPKTDMKGFGGAPIPASRPAD